MTRRELYVGAKVYHVLLYNWGEGEVLKCRQKDGMGCENARKFLVRWKGREGSIWMRASELRKTPRKR